MTATNALVTSRAAYLWTDGAIYDPDGIVTWLGSKVATAPAALMAMAVSGRGYAPRLKEILDTYPLATQDEVLAALPRVAQQMRAEQGALPVDGCNDVQIIAALYSIARRRPEAWVVSTNQAYLGPTYKPGTLVALRSFFVPDIDLDNTLGRPFDPDSFDPVVDGLACMLAQRNTPWDVDGCAMHCIGGRCEMATVTATGVDTEILARWPDEVGKVIVP